MATQTQGNPPLQKSILKYAHAHIPALKEKNWPEWNARMCNLLRPHATALDIMMGRIVEGDALYSKRVDMELLSLIDKKIHSDVYDVMLSVNTSKNPKGSLVYKALRAEYEGERPSPRELAALKNSLNSFCQGRNETTAAYCLRAQKLQAKGRKAGLFPSQAEEEKWVNVFVMGLRNDSHIASLASAMSTSSDIESLGNLTTMLMDLAV
ncbi:hypothetical protein CBS101457_002586 [Exobasidium rhododendri]|nr:hypothetical protein CBS101457_002586 [Exobasidium rhododendri]